MAESTDIKTIVKIDSLTINGIQVDPTNIISLEIIESIIFPGVTGKIAIRDFSSLKTIGEIFAGDNLQISFSNVVDKEGLNLDLSITESYGDVVDKNSLSNITSFGFQSTWLINGFTRKRSRPFVNKKISEIVEELITECGGNPGTIIPTKQTLERFVSPYWSPLQTIKYLMGFATDVDGHGGYLIWTDISSDDVHFIPVSTLMHATENFGEVGFVLTHNPVYPYSIERIYDQTIEQSFDIMKYSEIGMGRTKYHGFNYDRTEIISVDKKADEYDHNHLSTKLPINDYFMGRQFRSTRFSTLFYNTNELIRESDELHASDLVDAKLNTKYSTLFADSIKIILKTVGESYEKRAGRQVEINIPTPDVGKTLPNKHHSGTYLIRDIKHIIQGMQYANVLTVIADGYKLIERADMINWDGEGNEIDPLFDGDQYDVDDPEEILGIPEGSLV